MNQMSNSKTNNKNLEEMKKVSGSKSLKLCVIAIDGIGLPAALSFTKSGLQTIGVDINEK
jgi:UDP-N-acetyl-D-mannosaminuronate dehydrogenase